MRVCEFVMSFWKLCELRVCEFAARVAKVSNLKFSGEKNVRPSPSRTGGAVALKLRAQLSPAGGPRRTPVRGVPYPSLGAHIEVFWSAAATKREQLPARRDASGFSFLRAKNELLYHYRNSSVQKSRLSGRDRKFRSVGWSGNTTPADRPFQCYQSENPICSNRQGLGPRRTHPRLKKFP